MFMTKGGVLDRLRDDTLGARGFFSLWGRRNGPFAAGGHMVHAGGQAAHWDIQNKENSNLS